MKVVVIAALGVLSLSGCRSKEYSRADTRILFDKEGCAFYVRPNFGDTSFVVPMRDANQPTCMANK